MLKTQELWGQIRELHYSISASINHGEHWYEGGESLQYFLSQLDQMKRLSMAYHQAVKEQQELEEREE